MKYLIAFCMLLSLIACQESPKNTLLEAEKSELITLKSKLTEMEQERDSLQLLLANEQHVEKMPWFGAMESRPFKDMGIEDPIPFITEALRDNPSVIPMDGVLGGTMFFTEIELLGSKWIIASYEDGHIMGRGIFSYKIDPTTLEMKFELLDRVTGY